MARSKGVSSHDEAGYHPAQEGCNGTGRGMGL